MKIHRDHKVCYGCRACELACSFHHRGVFAPGGGAIRVRKDHQTGAIWWSMDSACDFCRGEGQPLCVRFCSYDALKVLT